MNIGPEGPAGAIVSNGLPLYEASRGQALDLLSLATEPLCVCRSGAGSGMQRCALTVRPSARILASRSSRRSQPELRPGDVDPEVALSSLLHALYDRAGYDLRVNYRGEPEPPLGEADAAWSDGLLRAAGVR